MLKGLMIAVMRSWWAFIFVLLLGVDGRSIPHLKATTTMELEVPSDSRTVQLGPLFLHQDDKSQVSATGPLYGRLCIINESCEAVQNLTVADFQQGHVFYEVAKELSIDALLLKTEDDRIWVLLKDSSFSNQIDHIKVDMGSQVILPLQEQKSRSFVEVLKQPYYGRLIPNKSKFSFDETAGNRIIYVHSANDITNRYDEVILAIFREDRDGFQLVSYRINIQQHRKDEIIRRSSQPPNSQGPVIYFTNATVRKVKELLDSDAKYHFSLRRIHPAGDLNYTTVVSYQIVVRSGDTATEDEDFETITHGVVRFRSNDFIAFGEFTILKDDTREDIESFHIEITHINNGIWRGPRVKKVVIEEENQVKFVHSNITVNETQGAVSIPIERFGNLNDTVNVTCYIVSGSAGLQDFYMPPEPQSEIFLPGNNKINCSVYLKRDSEVENPEYFKVYLTTSTKGWNVVGSGMTIYIRDTATQ